MKRNSKHWKKIVCAIVLMVLIVMGVQKTIQGIHAEQTPNNFNESPVYDESTNALTLPTFEGYNVELFGSDHKEIISLTGVVNKPLNETKVNLIYKLSSKENGDVIESRSNATITIPAREHPLGGSGRNTKPDVIPSLREWIGGDGNVTLTNTSRIVVSTKDKTTLEKVAIECQKDIKALSNLTLSIVYSSDPQAGDIVMSIDGEKELGKEGYYLQFGGPKGTDEYVAIVAPDKGGIYYGTMSILQILKQSDQRNVLPKGIARDYPMYENRGFMLDVARKYIPIHYLNDLLKQMSYYKLNSLQLHLNDNDIWDSLTKGQALYSAFRLESNVPGLTAKDGHYTKDEFRQLQLDALDQNVMIIPEIDSPGHALALTRAWPELEVKNAPKYIDVQNPKAVEQMKSLFDEYMSGENPVFVGKYVNIGTDEYKTGTSQEIKEAFRKYANELMEHVNSYPDKKVAIWGSLDAESGKTPVTNNALMLGWYRGYANAAKYLYEGYDIITMEDQEVYIVPGGGYYANQYGRGEYLYTSWKPNIIRNGGNDVIAMGHPRLKGGFFALWNDHIGNGISVWDISFRMKDNMKSVAQKTWANTESKKSYKEFKKLGDIVGVAPNSEYLFEHKPYPNDEVLMNDGELIENQAHGGLHFMKSEEVKIAQGRTGNALSFEKKNSYIQTDTTSIGYDWTTSMWIHPKKENEENAVLMEGRSGILKLKQGKTNKLGFSVENYDHYFEYTVPSERWTQLTLTGDAYGTSLYVNGEFKERLINRDMPNYNENSGAYKKPIYYETLNLPTSYIGSKTNSFIGLVDDFKVYDKVLSDKEIKALSGFSNSETINLARGKDVSASGSEVANKWQPSSVVDGVITGDSRWSSNYSDDAWLRVDLGEVKTISEVIIYWEQAFAKKYKIQVSLTGRDDTWTDVFLEEKGNGGKKEIVFAPQLARYIRFQGIERTPIGGQRYGYSFYELEVYEQNLRNTLLLEYNNGAELLEKSRYFISETKASELDALLNQAEQALIESSVSDEEVESIINGLKKVIPPIKQMLIAKDGLQHDIRTATTLASKVSDKISLETFHALQNEIHSAQVVLANRNSTMEEVKHQRGELSSKVVLATNEYNSYVVILSNAKTTLNTIKKVKSLYADIIEQDVLNKIVTAQRLLSTAIDNEILNEIVIGTATAKEAIQLGEQSISAKNVALRATASASSIEVAKFSADKAIDGNRTAKDSRWSSRASSTAKFSEWFIVDLGTLKTMDRVDIFWENSFAKKYKVLVSETGKDDYKEVAYIANGTGGHSILRFAPVSARYVKFEGIERTTGQWLQTYSFYEFEIYKTNKKSLEEVKSEIQSLIDSVKDLNEIDYTIVSWKEMQNIVKQASEYVKNEQSSIENGELIIKELKNNIQNLKVDKAALSQEIAKFEGREEEYTRISWSAFKVDLNRAKQIYADETATGHQVTTTRIKLIDASKQLVIRGNSKELETLVKEYEGVKANIYTTTTWNEFKKQLQFAQNVIQHVADKSQEEVDFAMVEVRTSFVQLVVSKIDENKVLETSDIAVIGDFYDNVSVVSTKLSQDDKEQVYNSLKDQNILKNYMLKDLVQVKFQQNGVAYAFQGNVQLKLEIPLEMQGKELFVYGIHKDGSMKLYKALALRNGSLQSIVEYADYYGVAAKLKGPTISDPDNEQGSPTNPNSNGKQEVITPNTGIATNAIEVSWLLLLVSGFLGFVFFKIKEKNVG